MVNRKYKDRLFCLIFGTEEYKPNALSLYNAVNNTSYTNVDDLTIYTLSDVVYMKMKNDVSYLFEEMISLYEQQSTINPNMPIRGLMYFAEMYSKYITNGQHDLYGKKLIRLPNPQYVVFYNGTEEYVTKKLRLSDAFIKPDPSGDFEWTARVVNINRYEDTVRSRCNVLNEYMLLVERIRTYSTFLPIEEAVDTAVQDCIREGILKQILLENRAEVLKMCITEFDEKLHNRTLHEEGYSEGHAEGLAEGREKIIQQMLRNGKTAVQIADFCGIDLKEVKKVEETIK